MGMTRGGFDVTGATSKDDRRREHAARILRRIGSASCLRLLEHLVAMRSAPLGSVLAALPGADPAKVQTDLAYLRAFGLAVRVRSGPQSVYSATPAGRTLARLAAAPGPSSRRPAVRARPDLFARLPRRSGDVLAAVCAAPGPPREVAGRAGMPEATAKVRLCALYEIGLVDRAYSGRSVRYEATPAGRSKHEELRRAADADAGR